ncbi:Fanconi anemia group D2 protein, partial [Cichlidogyrus casuarinus]
CTSGFSLAQFVQLHVRASTWTLERVREGESLVELTERQIAVLSRRSQCVDELIRRHVAAQLKRFLGERFSEYETDNGFHVTRENISAFFRSVLEAVRLHTNQLTAVSTQAEARRSHGLFLLAQWQQVMEWLSECASGLVPQEATFSVLSPLAVSFISGLMPVARACLLNMVNKGAVGLFNEVFGSHGLQVANCFRATQTLTRFLQRVCIHAKTHRALPHLVSQIPKIRQCLETFLYKVKLIMAKNQCVGAFWLGNLKNRDLHGLEIRQEDSRNSQELSPGSSSEDEKEVEEDLSSLSSDSGSAAY